MKPRPIIGRVALVISVAFILLAVSPVVALTPIVPPDEGSRLVNHTDVEMEEGIFWLTEDYGMDFGSADTVSVEVGNTTIYAAPFDAAKANYKDYIRAVDGSMRLVKDFTSSLIVEVNESNVVVERDIGYTRSDGTTVGMLTTEEKGGVCVFNAPSVFIEYVEGPDILAIYADEKRFTTAAGSALQMTDVQAHSSTLLDVTNAIAMSHSVSAAGVGTATAGMELVHVEGLELTTGYGEMEWPPYQIVDFSDRATAIGIFSFSKSMYGAVDDATLPAPWAGTGRCFPGPCP